MLRPGSVSPVPSDGPLLCSSFFLFAYCFVKHLAEIHQLRFFVSGLVGCRPPLENPSVPSLRLPASPMSVLPSLNDFICVCRLSSFPSPTFTPGITLPICISPSIRSRRPSGIPSVQGGGRRQSSFPKPCSVSLGNATLRKPTNTAPLKQIPSNICPATQFLHDALV